MKRLMNKCEQEVYMLRSSCIDYLLKYKTLLTTSEHPTSDYTEEEWEVPTRSVERYMEEARQQVV